MIWQTLLFFLNSVYFQFDSVIVLFRLKKNRVNGALYLAREWKHHHMGNIYLYLDYLDSKQDLNIGRQNQMFAYTCQETKRGYFNT
jgi:hypothetical protein